MLDQDFCDFLEYELAKAFSTSTDPSIKSLWCDGILLPTSEKEFSQKSINDNRFVLMKSYVGKDGQDEYELILNFGSKALSRYARGLDIKECVPSLKDSSWLEIDQEKRTIIVQLR